MDDFAFLLMMVTSFIVLALAGFITIAAIIYYIRKREWIMLIIAGFAFLFILFILWNCLLYLNVYK